MSLLNVFDVSGSAMTAQTVRLNTTASNLSNAQSVSSNLNETYRARQPVFATQLQTALDGLGNSSQSAPGGVRVAGIVESQAPLHMKYEPERPYADENGYVAYPNVNVVEEMANMMSASRSFQLNAEMMKSARTLAESLLRLGQ